MQNHLEINDRRHHTSICYDKVPKESKYKNLTYILISYTYKHVFGI